MIYFPGGKKEYLNTIRKFLDFVNQKSPTKVDAEKWFANSFGSTSNTLINRFIKTLKAIQLISVNEEKIELAVLGKKSTNPEFVKFIFIELATKILGFSEILDVLRKKSSSSLNEIIEYLKTADIEWDTKTQYIIRLNWLLSLGYAIQKGPLYEITEAGMNAQTSVSDNALIPSHEDLKKAVVKIGENLGLRAFSENEASCYRLDDVWIQSNENIPVFAAEIQLNERDLEKSLARLALGNTMHIYNLCLYTKEELIPKAEFIRNKLYPELADKLEILSWSRIEKETNVSEMWKEFISKKFFYKPHMRWRRIRSLYQFKQVNEAELLKFLQEGWEIKHNLANGQVIIQREIS
jgi:hypothetical protein